MSIKVPCNKCLAKLHCSDACDNYREYERQKANERFTESGLYVDLGKFVVDLKSPSKP
jgi:hypothetical protein